MLAFAYPDLPERAVFLPRSYPSVAVVPDARRDAAEDLQWALHDTFTPRPPPPEPSPWFRFGGPLAVPIGIADVEHDRALATFMAAEAAAWRYLLVHSSVSFASTRGYPRLETADVEVTLRDDSEVPCVVAWSMLPTLASSQHETRSALTLGPSVKLQDADFSLGSFTRETARLGKDVFLVATGELTSCPKWSFCRTATVNLIGSHRLVMVVRAPVDTPLTMNVALSGSIRVGRFRRKIVRLERLTPDSAPEP